MSMQPLTRHLFSGNMATHSQPFVEAVSPFLCHIALSPEHWASPAWRVISDVALYAIEPTMASSEISGAGDAPIAGRPFASR